MKPDSAARLAVGALAVLIAVAALLAVVSFDPATSWNRLVVYVFTMQGDLHRELVATMRSLQDNEAAAAWSLAGLGCLYGVFHAAGPGHGKVVISTYLATHESRLDAVWRCPCCLRCFRARRRWPRSA